MYGRDKYISNVSCRVCDKIGAFQVSEENYPDNGDWKFSIDGVPKGFKLVREGASIATSEIICTTCGQRAE